MAPPALLFDLDGTLVDSARDIARALSMVSRARGGGTIDPAVVRPLVSLGASTLVTTALGPVASDVEADLAEFRHTLGGLPVDADIVYPGVQAALAALGNAGHPMAIVTNKPEALSRSLLNALALTRYFGAIVGGDSAPFAKPHRAPVDHALAAIGAKADDAIFIGDSDVDAMAAAGCDMPFLLYGAGYGAAACGPHAVAGRFDRFADLPSSIAALIAASSRKSGLGVDC